MEITELLVSESNTIATLSHYIATKQAKNGYSWTNFDFTNMVSSSETLPGFSPTQNLTTTSYFALSMTEANYNAMASNVEYLATVTLTITSL